MSLPRVVSSEESPPRCSSGDEFQAPLHCNSLSLERDGQSSMSAPPLVPPAVPVVAPRKAPPPSRGWSGFCSAPRDGAWDEHEIKEPCIGADAPFDISARMPEPNWQRVPYDASA